MKAILPVAGYGTRLKPHTDCYQKALLPVAGKPALDHIIAPMLSQGVEHLVFITGHLGQQIVDHMNRFTGQFEFIEQKEQLGLGHAVYLGLEDVDTPVIIQLGDTIFDLDYSLFDEAGVNQIVVGEVDDPSRFGVAETDGRRIVNFFEKVPDPPSNLAIAGLYFFASERRLKQALEELFEKQIQTKGEYQLTDAMALMLKRGEPFEFLKVDHWYDVGVPESYIDVNRQLMVNSHGHFIDCEIIEPVHIEPGVKIENSSIGPYVTIMAGATIRNCTISDCIVLNNSKLTGLRADRKIIGGDGSQIC